jgi:hypothetical protein
MAKYLTDRIDYHHIDPDHPEGPHYHRTAWGELVEVIAATVPCRRAPPSISYLYHKGYLVRRSNGHILFVEEECLSDHEICEGCAEPSPEGLTPGRYSPQSTKDSRLCARCLAASAETPEELRLA